MSSHGRVSSVAGARSRQALCRGEGKTSDHECHQGAYRRSSRRGSAGYVDVAEAGRQGRHTEVVDGGTRAREATCPGGHERRAQGSGPRAQGWARDEARGVSARVAFERRPAFESCGLRRAPGGEHCLLLTRSRPVSMKSPFARCGGDEEVKPVGAPCVKTRRIQKVESTE